MFQSDHPMWQDMEVMKEWFEESCGLFIRRASFSNIFLKLAM